jgi:hypothetical protein
VKKIALAHAFGAEIALHVVVRGGVFAKAALGRASDGLGDRRRTFKTVSAHRNLTLLATVHSVTLLQALFASIARY